MELKALLKQLHNTEGNISKEDVALLLPEMLTHIGTIDAELRDKLIYQTFIRIIDEEALTRRQFRDTLKTCLDEHHLFFRLGEKDLDSVFTRSFSSLVITGLLTKDRDIGLLSEEEIQETFDSSIYYLHREQDTRGYVEQKGWAHSVAHGADLLVSLVKHPKFTEEYATEVLSAIKHCLFKEDPYTDDEDERLFFVIEALLDNRFGDKDLEEWMLNVFNDLEEIHMKEGFSLKYFRVKFNISTFMKTCYFHLRFKDNHNSVQAIILVKLKELHHKLYGA
ncbi:DUF2785 domain-containing protein [Oceanobacillus picturae]|uniref:DUF2785 domain-containing protein n=1 Tax=Oceanobacillus picturae TaxID=171693 RepID=UPI00363C9A34